MRALRSLRFVVLLPFLIGLLGVGPFALGAPGGSDKVGVCHLTGDPGKPIAFLEVDRNGARAHERHGDQVGATSLADCVLPTVVPATATTAPSPTPTNLPPTTEPSPTPTNVPPTATTESSSTPTATTAPSPTPTVIPSPTATVMPSPTPTTCFEPITITLRWGAPHTNLDARMRVTGPLPTVVVSPTNPNPYPFVSLVAIQGVPTETITIQRDFTTGFYWIGSYHLVVQNTSMDAPFTNATVEITRCNQLVASYQVFQATGNPAYPTWDVFTLHVLDPQGRIAIVPVQTFVTSVPF